MTKEEIMEAIENMTVLELSELVKAMEEVIQFAEYGTGRKDGLFFMHLT